MISTSVSRRKSFKRWSLARRKNSQRCLEGQPADYTPMQLLLVPKLRGAHVPGSQCPAAHPRPSPFLAPPQLLLSLHKAGRPPLICGEEEGILPQVQSIGQWAVGGGSSSSGPGQDLVGQPLTPTSGCLQVALNTCDQALHRQGEGT